MFPYPADGSHLIPYRLQRILCTLITAKQKVVESRLGAGNEPQWDTDECKRVTKSVRKPQHTHDRHTQTLMACNKQLPKEEKYLDYYCRPPAGLELSSRQDGQQQQRRRNRRKSHAPSRVGGGFLSSSTRRRYNGIVRVGIVHSILDSSFGLPSSLIGQMDDNKNSLG
jgi:hypothetical protein